MSSAGISPLAIIAPDLYAKQLAIQQRQAMAQALLQNGQDPGKGGYGGLRSAGSSILGAILAKKSMQDMAGLYAPQQDQQAAQSPQPQTPETQISNNPGSGPVMAPQTPSVASGQASQPSQAQAMGQALQAPQGQSAPSPQAMPQMAQTQPQMQQQPRSIPQAMAGAIPDLPGMTHQQSMLEYFQDPQDYWKAIAPTPEYRNALMAAGGDPQQAQAMLGAAQTKAGAIPTTRGMVQIPDGNGGYRTSYAPPPAPAGFQYQQGQGGGLQLVPVQGGQQAVAGAALAGRVPTALTTPATGFDQTTNKPVASNALAMSGNAGLAPQMGIGGQLPIPSTAGLNINANNPLNMQPGGQQAQYATPTAGFGTAWDNLSAYGKQGVNTISDIVKRWAPNAPSEYAANVAATLKVAPDQPLNLNDPNVKGLLIDAMRPNETGNKYQQPQGPSALGLMPELPPGVKTAAEAFSSKTGGIAGDEYANTKEMAADVPTRLNVLQSILKLSQAGAPTGTPEWMNEARQTAAALGQALGHPVDAASPASLMVEIHKYMGQYSNRMAEGGNETDARRLSAEIANPNPDMFPATLQRVVPWIMANELGIKAKANFLDTALAGNQNNPAASAAAQAQWRNTYTPRIAQFEMMTPQQQAGYVHDPRAFRDAADRQKFIKDAMTLHPYFSQGQ